MKNLTLTQKILGAGSFVSFIGFLLMLVANKLMVETFNLKLLVFPIIGLITTFWSFFYAYKGKSIKEIDSLWLIGVSLFWFLLLPLFWYKKIYKVTANET